jgi:hypothetical protein
VDGMALDVRDAVVRVLFIPATVEVFSDQAELNDQDARQVQSRRLAPFFAPQAMKRLFVLAHDGAGIRAADEVTSVASYCGGAVKAAHSSAFTELVWFVIVAPEYA